MQTVARTTAVILGTTFLSGTAVAGEEKAPTLTATPTSLSLVCGKTVSLTVSNELAVERTIDIVEGQAADETGASTAPPCKLTFKSSSEKDPGRTFHLNPGEAVILAVEAGASPSAEQGTWTESIALVDEAAPGAVVRVPVKLRAVATVTKAALAPVKPAVSEVKATFVHPWGKNEILIPLASGVGRAEKLVEDGVTVGFVTGNDVTVGLQASALEARTESGFNKPVLVLTAVGFDGVGDLSGTIDFNSGGATADSEESDQVEVTVVARDAIWICAIFVFLGVLVSALVLPFLRLQQPRARLRTLLDSTKDRYDTVVEEVHKAAEPSTRSWSFDSLWEAETKPINGMIDELTLLAGQTDKLTEAEEEIEDEITELVAELSKVRALGLQLQKLKRELDLAAETVRALTSPGSGTGEPAFATRARQMFEPPEAPLESFDEVTAVATAVEGRAKEVSVSLGGTAQRFKQYDEDLKDLEKPEIAIRLTPDDRKKLQAARNDWQGALHRLWVDTDAAQLDDLDTELDDIEQAINELWHYTRKPAPTVRVSAVSDAAEAVSVAGVDPATISRRSLWVKALLANSLLLVTAAFLAEVTALGTLYIGKAWGGPWDYTAAAAWGLGAEAVIVATGGAAVTYARNRTRRTV